MATFPVVVLGKGNGRLVSPVRVDLSARIAASAQLAEKAGLVDPSARAGLITRNAGDLLAEFKATGRQDAFEEIVRRYAAMVFGVCLKTTRNAHDAEDATQAVFLTLAVQCKTGSDAREISYVGPWLQKVARRISLDIRRSRKRRQAREETHATTNGHVNGNGNGTYTDEGASGAGIDVEELKVVLNEELNQLPAKYRLPMILHYYGGLTREQIAAELGCKPSTLGVRIHRGRQMLAKRLTERGASPVQMGMSLGAGLTLAVRSAVSDGMVASTSKAAAKLMAGEELGAMISSHVLAVAHGAVGAALMAKFKLVAAVVVVALVTVAAGATAKVLPIDQLKIQWPVRFDGLFNLPSLRSPFRLPRASTGWTEEGAPRRSALAFATRAAATDAAVQTVLWLAEGDNPFSQRPNARPNASSSGRSRRNVPGIGSTERLVTEVVSTVVGANVARASDAAKSGAMPVAAPALALNAHRGPVPPAAPAFSASAAAGSPSAASPAGAPSIRMSGSVQYSDGAATPLAGNGQGGGGAHPSGPVPPPRTEIASAGPTVTLGGAAGSVGRIDQDGGRFEADNQVIGGRGHGVYRQRGGENIATNMTLGVDPGSVGEYHLEGGVLTFKPGSRPTSGDAFLAAGDDVYSRTTGLRVGERGTGVFNLGNARGTGEIDTTWNSPASSLVVRGSAAGTGVFRGWGRVSMGGFFDHSGQAVADGYGYDRVLEFSGFRYVGNSIENPAAGGTAGWFAQNHGKLVLPDFHVRPGTATYTWGEDPGDPLLDLVNSTRLTVHDAENAGFLRVALLSKDNGEVPLLPRGHTFIGVWQFDPHQVRHGAVDIVVRYDDGLAHDLGLNENSLKLWRYSDGQWLRINDETFFRDVNNHILGGTAPAGFEFFAVSAPEPSAIGLALFAAAATLLRRPRRSSAGRFAI